MDECGICGCTKEEHNHPDIHHQFSETGQLVPKGPTRRPAAGVELTRGDVVLRLITVLRAKGVLTSEDLNLIFPEASSGQSNTD